MTILAIDTTSEFGSIAIRQDGHTLLERPITSPGGFAHVIFSEIRDILAEAKVSFEDTDCFAAASGPGSFTGLRVGLSVVKGLADALGKPAVGVSNLRALASFGNSGRRAVLIDARRGEIYGAIYNSALEPIVPEQVFKDLEWIGPDDEVIRSDDHRVLAGATAACAELESSLGGWQDPAALDANYVRRSDAELFWKEE